MPAGDVHLTGNTVIDALLQTIRPDYVFRTPALRGLDPSRRLMLVTTHRRESFGAPLESICAAVRELGARFPDLQFVLPVHPNPQVKQTVESLLRDLPGMFLIEPVDYVEFVNLMNRAYLVLTDSGGVQEEAPSLGKPVLVLRDVTERPGGRRGGDGGGGRHRSAAHRGGGERADHLRSVLPADGQRGQSLRRWTRERPDPRGAGGALRMRLLVTGGTGFIGSHLAVEGRRRGAEVVVLGLTDRPEEQANVALLRGEGVEVRLGEHHRCGALRAGP